MKRKFKKRLLAGFVFWIAVLTLHAQTKKISGYVFDSTAKTAIADASISVPGTKQGTVSASNGFFSLQTSGGQINVSAVGYQSQTITVRGSEQLSISLVPVAGQMNDVIVTGYTAQKRKDITGAVATIGARDVGDRNTVKLSEALQGSLAGVSVTRSGSAPGAGSSILIRGITTLNTNTPLIVVDGVYVSSIDYVNPNDVESVTVLKDAAAAVYGSTAAAGVILITTKRGAAGAGSLQYNYEYGFQKPLAQPVYVNSPTYMRLFDEMSTNDGAATGPYPQDYIDHFADSVKANPDKFPFANTDWQKEILTHSYAPRQDHSLVYTAGTDKIKTKISADYTNVGALYDNANYKRVQFRLNNDVKFNSKLNSNIDISFLRSMTLYPVGFYSGDNNAIYESRVMPDIYQAYYSNGQLAPGKDGRNPVAQIQQGGFDKSSNNVLTGRFALNFYPIKELRLTAQVAPTLTFSKDKNFAEKINFNNPDGTPGPSTNRPRTDLAEDRYDAFNVTGQFITDYNKSFKGIHNLDVLGVFEEYYTTYEDLTASRSGFQLPYPYLDAGSNQYWTNGSGTSTSARRSFMGTVNYNFKNTYYLQGILRNDNSSRFNAEHRSAWFPSLSAGWVLTEEKFMKHMDWLSFLKLRASYGTLGNERIGDYAAQALINFSNVLFYQNGSVVPLTGGNQQTYAIPDISWETTQIQNIGLDANFLKNRLSASADYYYKKTKDILLTLAIPLNLGYSAPQQNAGIMGVHGWEFTLGWKDQIGQLHYSASFNISDAKSKIIDLKGVQFLGDQATFKGSEFNEWYGYKTTGIYQTAADTVGKARTSSKVTVGDIGYIDQNNDGKIDPANDRVLLGGSLPRYNYGGNIRLNYKGVDFGIIWQGVGKVLTRLNSDVTRPFLEAFGNVSTEIADNYWSTTKTAEQNLTAKYPRLSTVSASNNYALSDFWLINGAYFRLKNVTMGYTFRQTFLQKMGVQSMRLYVSGNDLFSVSHFPKYIDPESGNAAYPIMTTYSIGASVKF